MKKNRIVYWIVGGVIAGFVLSLIASGLLQPKVVNADDSMQGPERIQIKSEILNPPLTDNSSISDVLSLMAQSQLRWNTIHITYFAHFQAPNDQSSSSDNQQEFWLTSDGKGRVEIGSLTGTPNFIWVNDKTNTWTEDLMKGTYYSMNVPRTVQSMGAAIAHTIPQTNPETIVPNPFALMIPSGLNEYIYPASIAQEMSIININEKAEQTVEVLGSDTIAGRKVVVIQRKIQSTDEQATIYKLHKYWIDAETGIMLKVEVDDPMTGFWVQQIEANSVDINVDIPLSMFVFQPDPNAKLIKP